MLPIILALMVEADLYTKDEADQLVDKLNTVPHPYDFKDANKLIKRLLKEIRQKDL